MVEELEIIGAKPKFFKPNDKDCKSSNSPSRHKTEHVITTNLRISALDKADSDRTPSRLNRDTNNHTANLGMNIDENTQIKLTTVDSQTAKTNNSNISLVNADLPNMLLKSTL